MSDGKSGLQLRSRSEERRHSNCRGEHPDARAADDEVVVRVEAKRSTHPISGSCRSGRIRPPSSAARTPWSRKMPERLADDGRRSTIAPFGNEARRRDQTGSSVPPRPDGQDRLYDRGACTRINRTISAGLYGFRPYHLPTARVFRPSAPRRHYRTMRRETTSAVHTAAGSNLGRCSQSSKAASPRHSCSARSRRHPHNRASMCRFHRR